MRSPTAKRAKAAAAVAIALLSLTVPACGSGESSGDGSSDAPSYERALKAAPPKLAQLYADGSALIEGGEDAYFETLDSVRGYPAVVNEWGSWCGPCREEFPHFQEQAAEHLDEVAFLGVDSLDSPDAYETFLRDNPIPYPSVANPDGELPSWVGESFLGQPNTLFYDASGELVFIHRGPYTDGDDLAADIEKYALSS